MENLNYPYVFEGGKKAVASEVNANFDAVKLYANSINAEIQSLQTAIGKLEEKPTREMFDIYFAVKGETPTGAYPLWTGETITNCKVIYHDFWKELNRLADAAAVPTVETDAAFDDMVEEYGQCPCFFIDKLNGHVRLPKIVRFISSISDLAQIGTACNDQMKSHKHGLPGANSYCAGGGRTLFVYGASDAAAQANYRESSAIGENETYPKHVRLPLYIQVVNNSAEISRFDVDALKKELEKSLIVLQAEYDKYAAGLQAEYDKIKAEIAGSSSVYKVENVAVAKTAFVADETYTDYPFKVDVVLPQVSKTLVPTVFFSLDDVESGIFAPVAESGAGYVRIWAKKVPNNNLIIPTVMCQ